MTTTINLCTRNENPVPIFFRLAMKDDGLVLQGLIEWTEYGPEGETGGCDWRDMPIVDLREKTKCPQ